MPVLFQKCLAYVIRTNVKYPILLLIVLMMLGRVALWDSYTTHLGQCLLSQPTRLNIQPLNIEKRTGMQSPHFQVATAKIHSADECPPLAGEKLRLSWFGELPLQTGIEYTVAAKVRPPIGLRNPGGFQYDQWLRGQGFMATGTILQVLDSRDSEDASYGICPQCGQLPKGLVFPELLRALTLGHKQDVTQDHWQILKSTGTVHLFVVSGLHVSLLFALACALCWLLLASLIVCLPYSCIAKLQHRNLRLHAALGGLLIVWLFVFVNQFQPPVLRAGLAVTVVVVFVFSKISSTPFVLLGICAGLAIFVFPQHIHLAGFWLSYAAVACLMFGHMLSGRQRSAVRMFLKSQLLMWVLLAAWVGYFVGPIPTSSVAANVVAVPWMSLFVIPLSMFSILLVNLNIPMLIGLTDLLLKVCDFGLWVLVGYLQSLSALEDEFAVTLAPIGYLSLYQSWLVFGSALLLFSPLAWRYRGIALFGLVCVMFNHKQDIPNGHFTVQILDVGQGSSALVRTADFGLLVDTGPAYPLSFDAGRDVVVPFVEYTSSAIHRVLISHRDVDHDGGLEALFNQYGPIFTITPDNCDHIWERNKVTFQLFIDQWGATKNDRSCTLLVNNGKQVVYFSGDIASAAEKRLYPQLPRNIDLLIAPHHGSAGSSSWPFVAHLNPQISVFSAGKYNRYDHPRAEVVARYVALGGCVSITGNDGALLWQSMMPGRLVDMNLKKVC